MKYYCKGIGDKMYQNKIVLTPQEILEKEFKIDTRGYRLKEVDQFLDTIIGDYEQFFNMVNDLEREKADLLAEVMNLKQELRIAKNQATFAKNNESNEMSNLDIMRRLSRLEKIVYGSDTTKENLANKEEPDENEE